MSAREPAMQTEARRDWVAAPSELSGALRVPGDKSISHRAVMLGAIAEGKTEIRDFLAGADCVATLGAMRTLGVEVEVLWPDHLIVNGAGLHGLSAPGAPLDLGNAGTGMRLLAGLLAGQRFDSVLVGDDSLMQRPMNRIAEPLGKMGAVISTTDGHAPLRISGRPLTGIRYELPVASAQVKSALLLAGLYAEGETVLVEPAVTRDHTERMLRWFGCEVQTEGRRVSMAGGQQPVGREIDVPGDFSAAAFFIVAAAIREGAQIVIHDVCVNATRIGLLDLLTMMGADICLTPPREVGGECVADIRVRGRTLDGIDVPPELVALAIDEFPALFVAAACARGTTRVSGAAELRYKESDRIHAMAIGLKRLGVRAVPSEDGVVIIGGPIAGGTVDSFDDHRVAMAFAVAATVADKPVRITNVNNVATSFPDFVERARGLGMKIVEREVS